MRLRREENTCVDVLDDVRDGVSIEKTSENVACRFVMSKALATNLDPSSLLNIEESLG
jgi:hypothetical protein